MSCINLGKKFSHTFLNFKISAHVFKVKTFKLIHLNKLGSKKLKTYKFFDTQKSFAMLP